MKITVPANYVSTFVEQNYLNSSETENITPPPIRLAATTLILPSTPPISSEQYQQIFKSAPAALYRGSLDCYKWNLSPLKRALVEAGVQEEHTQTFVQEVMNHVLTNPALLKHYMRQHSRFSTDLVKPKKINGTKRNRHQPQSLVQLSFSKALKTISAAALQKMNDAHGTQYLESVLTNAMASFFVSVTSDKAVAEKFSKSDGNTINRNVGPGTVHLLNPAQHKLAVLNIFSTHPAETEYLVVVAKNELEDSQ